MAAPTTLVRTLEWIGGAEGHLRLLDQTLLPAEVAFRDCNTAEEVWEAIKQLRVRGAPAIGVAAAYGVVLGLGELKHGGQAWIQVRRTADYLRTSRPTAVNLFWALQRMEQVAQRALEPVLNLSRYRDRLLQE